MSYYPKGQHDSDDVDDFDPNPYGGGCDIALTYGRPLPHRRTPATPPPPPSTTIALNTPPILSPPLTPTKPSTTSTRAMPALLRRRRRIRDEPPWWIRRKSRVWRHWVWIWFGPRWEYGSSGYGRKTGYDEPTQGYGHKPKSDLPSSEHGSEEEDYQKPCYERRGDDDEAYGRKKYLKNDEVWEGSCFTDGARMARSMHGLQLSQNSLERHLVFLTKECIIAKYCTYPKRLSDVKTITLQSL